MKSLNRLTKAELLTKAKQSGVTVPDKATKDELKFLILSMESIHSVNEEFDNNTRSRKEILYSFQCNKHEVYKIIHDKEAWSLLSKEEQQMIIAEHREYNKAYYEVSRIIQDKETWSLLSEEDKEMFRAYYREYNNINTHYRNNL